MVHGFLMCFIGEAMADDEVETLFRDCMDPEDEEGMIPYAREFKSKKLFENIFVNVCVYVNVFVVCLCICEM